MNPLIHITKWYTLIELAIGVYMLMAAYKRPKWFWPLILIGAIIGQGPLFLGYGLFDELLMICVILGALIRINLFKVKSKSPSNGFSRLQIAVFLTWIGYMIIESVVGIMINDDIRLMRWVVLYAFLGILSLITYYYSDTFPFPPLKQALKIVLTTVLIYSVLYIATGMIYDLIFDSGAGRFYAQYLHTQFVWSGTATAVFPYLIAMPVAVIALNEKNSWRVLFLAWSVIFLLLSAGHFYDSRMTFVLALGCFVVSINRFKIRSIVVMVLIFLSAFAIFYRGTMETVDHFVKGIFYGTQALWLGDREENRSDLCRKLQFDAAVLRLTDNPVTFLVGDGVYSHRFTMIPYIEKLYSLHMPYDQLAKASGWNVVTDNESSRDFQDPMGSFDIFRTTGLSALIIDTGIIGISLFLLNYVIVGISLLGGKSRYRFLLLFVLTLSFWWLFVNNVVDVTILYFLIMPGSFLERLSQSTKITCQPKNV